ncbi:hypothetical protein GCM10027432_08360 [Lysobacter fragariae]
MGPRLAVAAEAPAEQDQTGNRIEAFEPIPAEAATATATAEMDSSAMHCTQDRRWCARIRSDAQAGRQWLELFDQTVPVEQRRTWRHELPAGDSDESPTLWPRIVRMPEADDDGKRGRHIAIVGVVTHLSTGYSGGGASADYLGLVKVDAAYGGEAAFAEVLSVPVSGSVMIRACFSEEDVKNRAEACHDEYNFSATLALDDAKSLPGALPQFSYVTQATSFPGPISRSADSLANPPLREEDLVTVVNDECSYSRILRFNPATGRYEFDSPVPDCSDFTVP